MHCPVHSYEHTSSTVCLTHPPCLACPLPFSDWLPIELQMGSMHHSLSCLSCPVPTRYMPDAGLYGNSSMYSAGVVADFAACIAVCDTWGSPSVGGPKPGTYCQWLTVSPCDSATNDCSQPCKQATPLNISCRTQDFRCRKDNWFPPNPPPPWDHLFIPSCSSTTSAGIARSATPPSRFMLGEYNGHQKLFCPALN